MITSNELKRFLNGQVDAYDQVVLDAEYSLPTREWVLEEWGPAFKRDLERVGASRYRKERNDCDKFALLCMAWARLANNDSNPNDRSLAFGFLSYTRDSDSGHAINFAVIRNAAGLLEMLYFEPQTQREVKLSETERGNAISYIV